MEGHSLRQRWIQSRTGNGVIRQYRDPGAGGLGRCIVRGSLLSANFRMRIVFVSTTGVPRRRVPVWRWTHRLWTQLLHHRNSRWANRDGGVSRHPLSRGRRALLTRSLGFYLRSGDDMGLGMRAWGRLLVLSQVILGLAVAVRCCSAALVYDTVEASRSTRPFSASNSRDLVGDRRILAQCLTLWSCAVGNFRRLVVAHEPADRRRGLPV